MEHCKKTDPVSVTSRTMIHLEELLPLHLRTELKSTNMDLISRASLLDPQTIGAEGKISVVLDKIDKEDITIRCFSSTQYSSYHHTLLMCNTINEIFIGESTSDNDAVRVYLQAMVLIFGKGVLNAIREDNILNDAGLNLLLDEIDPNDAQAMEDLGTDSETVDCMNKMMIKDMHNPRIIAMAYCGTILLLAGKQLTEASVINWTQRRIRGLSASMGTTIETTSVTPFNLQASVRIYQKLSMLVPLRASMVKLLFGSTGVGKHVAALSAAMLNLLAWSEMNHIRMIQDYIFGRFPELLAMKQLQGSSIGVLRTAWSYLNKLDERERPYAKLLYGPQETKALQRDQFVLLTDAAHEVGTYLHSSLSNYKGDTIGTAGAGIKKLVKEYLISLERTGQLVIQSAQYTTMDSRLVENIPKADLLFRQQLDDLDAEVKSLARE